MWAENAMMIRLAAVVLLAASTGLVGQAPQPAGALSAAELAASLGVTPRSLYKVLRAARADFHRRQSAILERALTELDERYGLK